MIMCEWYKGGYCEYYGDADDQEQRETNWPCAVSYTHLFQNVYWLDSRRKFVSF